MELADDLLPAPVLRPGDEDVPQSPHPVRLLAGRGVEQCLHVVPDGPPPPGQDQGLAACQGEEGGDCGGDQAAVITDQHHSPVSPHTPHHRAHLATGAQIEKLYQVVSCRVVWESLYFILV